MSHDQKKRRNLLGCCVAAVVLSASAASAGEDSSCAGVCRAHPERVRKLFAALDLERKELKPVKAAVGRKDWPAACRALLAHYRDAKDAGWLRLPPVKPGTKRDSRADPLLKDTFTIQAVTARQPRLKNGRLNWAHRGPRNDQEWAWLLNRHGHFGRLLGAWRKTGNPAYARCFDGHVRDWVASNPYPAKSTGSAQWRVLEVGLRLRASWPRAFYGFQRSKAFTPAGRILMLSSVPEHADCCRRFHAGGGNHVLMEMYGLANAAVCWPEFKNASKWFSYAAGRMLPEMGRQVYPDGVQKELTSHYHWVSLVNFEPFTDLARRSGRAIPAEYLKGVERMWNYLAYSMRPDGYGALNNDSDRDRNRPRVLKAAEKYKRADWTYIATSGKAGKKPAGPPSAVFPWAGQAVMRSGWDAAAHWAFFDVGPAGIGHRHADRLHLSIAAFGRDLLVDGGRYWYKGGSWRSYFTGSASHNLILPDGAGQNMGPSSVRSPMKGNYALAPEFDYARGSFDAGYRGLEGKAAHTRAVLYVRGGFWVVVDRVRSDRPRRLAALWHFHPECSVAAEGLSAASADAGKGNLRIVPVGGPGWKLEIVKGRTKPAIQGWYSETYNVKKANATAVYTAKVGKAATFAWVLVPARGRVPAVEIEALKAPAGAVRVKVTLPGGKGVEVAVRLAGKAPVPLSGGLKLDGDCAILRPGAKPLVAGGRVTDAAGRAAAEHRYGK